MDRAPLLLGSMEVDRDELDRSTARYLLVVLIKTKRKALFESSG